MAFFFLTTTLKTIEASDKQYLETLKEQNDQDPEVFSKTRLVIAIAMLARSLCLNKETVSVIMASEGGDQVVNLSKNLDEKIAAILNITQDKIKEQMAIMYFSRETIFEWLFQIVTDIEKEEDVIFYQQKLKNNVMSNQEIYNLISRYSIEELIIDYAARKNEIDQSMLWLNMLQIMKQEDKIYEKRTTTEVTDYSFANNVVTKIWSIVHKTAIEQQEVIETIEKEIINVTNDHKNTRESLAKADEILGRKIFDNLVPLATIIDLVENNESLLRISIIFFMLLQASLNETIKIDDLKLRTLKDLPGFDAIDSGKIGACLSRLDKGKVLINIEGENNTNIAIITADYVRTIIKYSEINEERVRQTRDRTLKFLAASMKTEKQIKQTITKKKIQKAMEKKAKSQVKEEKKVFWWETTETKEEEETIWDYGPTIGTLESGTSLEFIPKSMVKSLLETGEAEINVEDVELPKIVFDDELSIKQVMKKHTMKAIQSGIPPLLQQIASASYLIIDLNNCMRAMSYSPAQIILLIEIAKHLHIQPLIFTDHTNRTIVNQLSKESIIAIIAAKHQHDDILMAEWATRSNAIIVSSDSFSEFLSRPKVCVQHNQLVLRRLAVCPMSEISETSCQWRTLDKLQLRKVMIRKLSKINNIYTMKALNKIMNVNESVKFQTEVTLVADFSQQTLIYTEMGSKMIPFKNITNQLDSILSLTSYMTEEQFFGVFSNSISSRGLKMNEFKAYRDLKEIIMNMTVQQRDDLKTLINRKLVYHSGKLFVETLGNKVFEFVQSEIGEWYSENKNPTIMINDKEMKTKNKTEITRLEYTNSAPIENLIYDGQLIDEGFALFTDARRKVYLMKVDQQTQRVIEQAITSYMQDVKDIGARVVILNCLTLFKKERIGPKAFLKVLEVDQEEAQRMTIRGEQGNLQQGLGWQTYLNPVRAMTLHNTDQDYLNEMFNDLPAEKYAGRLKVEDKKHFEVGRWINARQTNPFESSVKMNTVFERLADPDRGCTSQPDIDVAQSPDRTIVSPFIELASAVKLTDNVWYYIKKVIQMNLNSLYKSAHQIRQGGKMFAPDIVFGWEMDKQFPNTDRGTVTMRWMMPLTMVDVVVVFRESKVELFLMALMRTGAMFAFLDSVTSGKNTIYNTISESLFYEGTEYASIRAFGMLELLFAIVPTKDRENLVKIMKNDEYDDRGLKMLKKGEKYKYLQTMIIGWKPKEEIFEDEIILYDPESTKFIASDLSYIPLLEYEEHMMMAFPGLSYLFYSSYYPFLNMGLITEEQLDKAVLSNLIGLSRMPLEQCYHALKSYNASAANWLEDKLLKWNNLHTMIRHALTLTGTKQETQIGDIMIKYGDSLLRMHHYSCPDIKKKYPGKIKLQDITYTYTPDYIKKIGVKLGEQCVEGNEQRFRYVPREMEFISIPGDKLLVTYEDKQMIVDLLQHKTIMYKQQTNRLLITDLMSLESSAIRVLSITNSNKDITNYRSRHIVNLIENEGMASYITEIKIENVLIETVKDLFKEITTQLTKETSATIIIMTAYDQFPSQLKNVNKMLTLQNKLKLTIPDNIMKIIIPDTLLKNVITRMIRSQYVDRPVEEKTQGTQEKEVKNYFIKKMTEEQTMENTKMKQEALYFEEETSSGSGTQQQQQKPTLSGKELALWVLYAVLLVALVLTVVTMWPMVLTWPRVLLTKVCRTVPTDFLSAFKGEWSVPVYATVLGYLLTGCWCLGLAFVAYYFADDLAAAGVKAAVKTAMWLEKEESEEN